MFQEPVHDAAHGDIRAESFDPGPQATDAAHDEVNLHARLRCAVERLDGALVHQRVELGNDARGQTGASIGDFALN